jgi:hypothetical protein
MQRTRPTPALLVALLALILSLSGAAVALPGVDRVGKGDIQKNAVRSQHVKGKSLKGADLADGTIGSKQVGLDSLNASDIDGFEIADDSPTRVIASVSALGLAAARGSAPETVLYEEGDLTIYAKCYRDAPAGEIAGAIFARSSSDGALLDGAGDLPADDGVLLGPATAEDRRALALESTTVPNSADFATTRAALIGADGTSFGAEAAIAVKQGDLAGGNGVFGQGDVCLFTLTSVG